MGLPCIHFPPDRRSPDMVDSSRRCRRPDVASVDDARGVVRKRPADAATGRQGLRKGRDRPAEDGPYVGLDTANSAVQ